jgi:putative tryptophan/tyrosine transport system substrate-binding protein
VQLKRAAVRMPADIVDAVAELASVPKSGLAVLTDAFKFCKSGYHPGALAKYPLPHIVPWREYVTGGGMMSYGPNFNDIFRQSANYVDRILKGAAQLLPRTGPTAPGGPGCRFPMV